MNSLCVVLCSVLSQVPDAGERVEPVVVPVVEPVVAPVVEPVVEAPVATPVTPPVAEPVAAVVVAAPVPWYQRVTVSGFARVSVGYTFPLADEQLVGGNGGFRVADFRVSADFRPIEKFQAFTSVELAAPLLDAADPLTGRRVVELRDAFVQYQVCSGFIVRAGQFRPPYDAEMLQGDGELPFISRSVLSGGFSPPEAYGPRIPLAPDRQIGVQVHSLRFGGKNFGLRYMAGVFNGNGLNALLNDNNAVAPFARVEADWSEHVTLGLNGGYNSRADGVRPNRLYTNQLSYGADLTAKGSLSGNSFSGMAAFLGRNSTFNYAGLLPENAMGLMAQVRYLHEKSGLEVAARFAWLEPSSAQASDQVNEVAAMIGWRPGGMPFRVLAQYSHRGEEAGVSYPNDSVDLMLHAVW